MTTAAGLLSALTRLPGGDGGRSLGALHRAAAPLPAAVLQSVDYRAVAPVLVLAVGVLGVLFAPRRWAPAAAGAVALVAAALIPLSVQGGHRQALCLAAGRLPDNAGGLPVGRSCSYVVTGSAVTLQLLVLGSLLVVLALSGRERPSPEFPALLLASATGMCVLVAARDLISLIVALEVLSLPSYVLAGLRRYGPGDTGRSARSAEAALTFFLLSVLSSAVSLLGAALLYGITGSIQVDRIAAQLARPDLHLPITAAAVLLTVAGFAFKVSAVPFHAWAPDVYDGAPLPVALWLAGASKAAGAAGLLTLLLDAFPAWRGTWGPLLAVLAVATMTLGNVVALQQTRVVRLLAWSSVAQAGYLLAPLGAVRDLGAARAATLAYLAIYAAATAGVFAAVAVAGRSAETLAGLRGLLRRRPVLTAALLFALANLAGLPPGVAGLFAKLVVVRAVLHGGAGWLASVVAVNTVLGLAVYLRIAVQALSAAPAPAGTPAGPATEAQTTAQRTAAPDGAAAGEPGPGRLLAGLALGAPAVVTAVLAVAPGALLTFLGHAGR